MSHRILTGDLLCIKCSYNLRTLSLDNNCPECGQTVRRTWNAARRGMYPQFRQVAQTIYMAMPRSRQVFSQ